MRVYPKQCISVRQAKTKFQRKENEGKQNYNATKYNYFDTTEEWRWMPHRPMFKQMAGIHISLFLLLPLHRLLFLVQHHRRHHTIGRINNNKCCCLHTVHCELRARLCSFTRSIYWLVLRTSITCFQDKKNWLNESSEKQYLLHRVLASSNENELRALRVFTFSLSPNQTPTQTDRLASVSVSRHIFTCCVCRHCRSSAHRRTGY